MKDNLYFISDLDRTIIHSKNKGHLCVEKVGEKEITYMTHKSYDGFLELLELEHFKFIPCTMRNLKQIMRVDFIRRYNPDIIICSNGAQIYINGKLDELWNKRIKMISSNEDVIKKINYIKTLKLTFNEIRNIEGFYITIKSDSYEEAKKNYDLLNGRFEGNIRIIHIGMKVFVIDERINKINAVDYITENFSIRNFFTAGDSEVDREFTKRGKAIIPKHGSFEHKNAFITEKGGIFSTEDIIDYLKCHC